MPLLSNENQDKLTNLLFRLSILEDPLGIQQLINVLPPELVAGISAHGRRDVIFPLIVKEANQGEPSKDQLRTSQAGSAEPSVWPIINVLKWAENKAYGGLKEEFSALRGVAEDAIARSPQPSPKPLPPATKDDNTQVLQKRLKDIGLRLDELRRDRDAIAGEDKPKAITAAIVECEQLILQLEERLRKLGQGPATSPVNNPTAIVNESMRELTNPSTVDNLPKFILARTHCQLLTELLLEIPNIGLNWAYVRSKLLSGIPKSVQNNIGSSGVANLDITQILDVVNQSNIAPLGHELPLLTLLDNAISLVPKTLLSIGFEETRSLVTIGTQVQRTQGMDLEAVISKLAGFHDPVRWVASLYAAMYPICRIELDGREHGTGFLVGENLVLTNHHVTHDTKQGTPLAINRLQARFDYYVGRDGSIASAKPYAVQIADLPNDKALDFAFLRVEGQPARDPVAGIPGAQPRGKIPCVPRTVEPNELLLILQHPDGRPMELAFDMVTAVLPPMVHYRTNTEGGSSGSPCFNGAWDLVALHHAGNKTAGYNQATLLSKIMDFAGVRELLMG